MPYHREELIQDLNQVAPYDWAGFLHDRVDLINPHADLAGIERGGYKLVYRDQLNASERTSRRGTPSQPAEPVVLARLPYRQRRYSARCALGKSSPTKARLAPGYRLIAVNGNIYSKEALNTAIVAAKFSTKQITCSCRRIATSGQSTSTTTTANAIPCWSARREPGTTSTRLRRYWPNHSRSLCDDSLSRTLR